MLFQRINRTDPEKIFVVAKNSYTSALTQGDATVWDYVTDKDGVSVERPGTTTLHKGAFAGIVYDATIAAAAYGLIQVYGHVAVLKARNVTGSAVTPGACLYMPTTAALYLEAGLKTTMATTTFSKRGGPVGVVGTTSGVFTSGTSNTGFIKAL